jgi:peptidoglycan/xylan/chitin deacetylase (PgdA/CDA1 family)
MIIYCLSLIFLISVSCSKTEVIPEEGRVLILMYHDICIGEPGNEYIRSVSNFESDLKCLADNNIKVIGFDDIVDRIPEGNNAIISFDDGYSSWSTLVRPLLLKYNMRATFFLWVSAVGTENYITWNEVEYMSRYKYPDGQPFTFESHTLNHPFLSTHDSAFIEFELRESKKAIESHTLQPVTVLALPYGDGYGNTTIINVAKNNNYEFIRTSKYGINDKNKDDYRLQSLPMLDSTKQSEILFYFDIL